MPIVKYLVSAGVGAGDIVLEEMDTKAGRVEPFKKYTDWYRVGIFALGLFGPVLGLPSDIADALLLSDIPLLEKTVWSAIKELKTGPAPATGGYVLEEVVEEKPAPKAVTRAISI